MRYLFRERKVQMKKSKLKEIMKKKFKVGQRVGSFLDEDDEFTVTPILYGEYNRDPEFGQIVEVLDNGDVKVDFDNKYVNDAKVYNNGQLVGYKPLLLPGKVLLLEDDVQAKFSELEKEFNIIAQQVEQKLKIAAQAIKEAQKLVKKELKCNLVDMYD